MIHKIFLCLILSLIACPPINASAKDIKKTEKLTLPPADFGDVRGFVWGVSPADVKKYETVALFDKVDDALFFIDDLHGIKTLISYEFRNDRLWRVTFDMQKDDYPVPQKILEDYMTFQAEITNKVGAPTDEKMIWSRNYYKDKPNRWGLAVYNGDLTLETIWWSNTTKIEQRLGAKDYDYNFKIIYTSRKAMKDAIEHTNKNNQQDMIELLTPPIEAEDKN